MKVLTGVSIKKENWEEIFNHDFTIYDYSKIRFLKENVLEVWSKIEGEELIVITSKKTMLLQGKGVITYYEIRNEKMDSETIDKEKYESLFSIPVIEVKKVFNIEDLVLNEPVKIQDIRFDKIFEIDTEDCVYFGLIQNNIAFIPVETNEAGDTTFRTAVLEDVKEFITKKTEILHGEVCRFSNTKPIDTEGYSLKLLRYGSDSIELSKQDINEIRKLGEKIYIYKDDFKAYKVYVYDDLSQKIFIYNEVCLDNNEGSEIYKRKIYKKSNLSTKNKNAFGFLSI